MQQVSRDNQFLEKPLLLLLSKSQLKAENKRQPKAFDRSIQRMNREKRKEKKKKRRKTTTTRKTKQTKDHRITNWFGLGSKLNSVVERRTRNIVLAENALKPCIGLLYYQWGYADIVWDNCSPKLSEYLESLHLAWRNENQTDERFKGTLSMRTKYDMRIFGVIPLMELQNDTITTIKCWKTMKNEMDS